jgi:hypothetical protein
MLNFNLPKPAIPIVLMGMLLGASTACSRRPSDETIAKDIQSKAATDPDTRESQVSVAAKDGKVTLTGKVKTPAAQKKLEQIAREEPGAASVDDQSTVAPEAPSTEQPVQAITPAPPVQAPTPAPAPPVEKPKPPQPIVIPAGTILTITTNQALSSKSSQSGQTFLGSLVQPISVKGRSALPTGSSVSGRVLTAKAKGKFKGEGELDLTLTSIVVRGHTYQIQTSVLSNTQKGKGKRTAATTGGGAAGGALIGGLAGGGKGAAIGAVVGGGAGLVGGAATGNKQIEIPAESALSFTLSAPLTLPPPGE